MSARNIFGMVRKSAFLLNELEAGGMRVEVGDDFARYRNLRSTCAGRGELSPIFNTDSSFIDETNGFWICGFDHNDEVIHTQAVHQLNLSGKTLGKHLQVHRHKYIVPDTTPDPDLTYFDGPEALKKVTGSVGYCGDFWLASRGLGGPRSQGATGLLSRLFFELVHQAWDPDYIFAFVPKQLATRGTHMRYGYSHCEPGRWVGPDQQVTHEEYMIWMSADDIRNVIEGEVEHLRNSNQVAALRTALTTVNSAS